MHPSVHAQTHPDKPAVVVAETGETISYGELDAASNRAAQVFRAHGLGHEDVVAFMLDNTPHYYGLTWGAQRAGLRYVCISSRLTQDETDYILENSGAKMLVVSASNYADAVSTWAFGSRSAFVRATDAWLDRNGLGGITVVEPTGIDPRNTATAADLITLGALDRLSTLTRWVALPRAAAPVSRLSRPVPAAGTPAA